MLKCMQRGVLHASGSMHHAAHTGQPVAATVRGLVLLQDGEFSARSLSTTLWMFGRLQAQPEQFAFSQLAAAMLTEQVRRACIILLVGCSV